MKIIIAGDFCPQNRVAKLIDRGDFAAVFDQPKKVLAKVDYSIVNFECPISKGLETPIKKQGPNLRCSVKGVQAIKWAGFDCVTLANNHFYDFGDEGVKNTLEACHQIGMDSVGGGINIKEASTILYKVIGDKTLAIINCCEHEFSIASETHGGSNPYNPVQQYYSILQAKQKADRVLVIVHGGHEHFQLPSPRMVEAYRFFIDAGADAVVNHHQHCFSGYEVYNGKPIFYGLGNFCFDYKTKRSGIWTEGYFVQIDFSSSTPVFEIHPYIQCADIPGIKMLPVDSFNKRINSINAIISNPEELHRRVEEYYSLCDDQYSNIFEPISGRIYLGAKRRGWLPSFISNKRKLMAANLIVCEAHRDKVIHYLMNC